MRLTIVSVIWFSLLGFWQSEFFPGATREEKKASFAPSIRAAKRGFPDVNFADGQDLPFEAANAGGLQPKVLTAADFDSDGAVDLVTADRFGALGFYRGNALRNSRGEGEKRRRGEREKGRKGERALPFYRVEKAFSLNISPDYLEAGDFNADGRKDVLAAAKNDNRLQLLAGDGAGNFAAPFSIAVDGNITAFAAGEIGRRDGQTDVVVSYTNNRGAFLAVFEHPESAFRRKPEIFKLNSPATALAIGNLDEDFYADIAAAGGNLLTIIHGRGQAYPWDLIPDSGIERPAAVIAARRLPFQIAALETGRFDAEKRGESLAVLGTDGNLYRLEAVRALESLNKLLPGEIKDRTSRSPFLPADADVRNLSIPANLSRAEMERQGVEFAELGEVKNGNEFWQKRQKELAEKFKNTDDKEIEKLVAEEAPRAREMSAKAKANFLKTISAKPSTLARWHLQTLAAGSPLAGAASSNAPLKMLRAKVSGGGAEDLILLDAATNKIQIVFQTKTANQKPQTEIAAFEADAAPVAVLPLRLNSDALHDLVVWRENSPVPSVVMTAPVNTFVVNTTADDGGNCLQPGQPCTLRDAIQSANAGGGTDSILFDIPGGGVHTLAPLAPLPVITQPVSIDGTSQPGYNGLPLVELSGVNLTGQAADGLKLRTSGSIIVGLAVNQFPSIYDPDTNTQTGGNGITIESTINFPNNGFNIIQSNFLGTDASGSLDKGNDATGLLIFDSDTNLVGGTTPNARNVMSGNGSRLKRGAGMSITAGNSNFIEGNIIGLNSLGTAKLGNSFGVFLTGAENVFGGDAAGAGNTVSGNGEPRPAEDPEPNGCDGEGMLVVSLFDLQTEQQLTLNNTLKGNRLGTNPAGTAGLGNCHQALLLDSFAQTSVGSIAHNGRNIISDNGNDALWCGFPGFTPIFVSDENSGYCAISGNNIGTDVTGQIELKNDNRNLRSGFQSIGGTVYIFNPNSFSNVGAPGGTSPGSCTGFCNVISGNDGWGVGVRRVAFGTVGIFNNFIGTNQTGNQGIPNSATGVVSLARFGTTYIGAVGNDGGNPVAMGNLLSGNGGAGIGVGDVDTFGSSFSTTFIAANLVGTDAFGNGAVPNGVNSSPFYAAVVLFTRYGSRIFVGGTDPAARNVVAGNVNLHGIQAWDVGGQTVIVNNLVGLNRSLQPLGNDGAGINILGLATRVGGSSLPEANIIAYNGATLNQPGVLVANGVLSGHGSFSNTIRSNSIFANAGLGIDLSQFSHLPDGVTANDCNDADTGGNEFQNFPELLAPVQNGDETLTVPGTLRSKPRQNFTLDFYASQTADPSQHGEGATHLGTKSVTTDGNGFTAFNFTTAEPVSAALNITATATDQYGSTSEFSCVAGHCTPLAPTLAEIEKIVAEGGFVCTPPIVVNINTDEPDANLADTVCDVDTSNDGLQCSLRAAIEEANARAGYNSIYFDIPGGGVQTISPTETLPTITERVSISGDTQPGYVDAPLIEINGANTTNGFGLVVGAGPTVVKGLIINRFSIAGIAISGGGGNEIEGCYIGTNADGTTADANNRMDSGIFIQNSSGNRIGGLGATSANVISNNQVGVFLVGGANNRVTNSKIGTDKTGMLALANDTGVSIDNSNENVIGGDALTDEKNIISANANANVNVTNNSQSNRIQGNLIGLKANGTEAFATRFGVILQRGAAGNIVGGRAEFPASNFGNVISGSDLGEPSAGVSVVSDAGANNQIIGNLIGTNESGDAPLPNFVGLAVFADSTIIGSTDAPNTISGNARSGIVLVSGTGNPTLSNTVIDGNLIGTNRAGDADVGNVQLGIEIDGDVQDTNILRNTISGNDTGGIRLTNGARQNTVRANKIGTNKAGTAAIANALGIGFIFGASENTVTENVISGNQVAGVLLGDGTGSQPSGLPRGKLSNLPLAKLKGFLPARIGGNTNFVAENKLQKNLIGTDASGETALPNQFGVVIGENARNNQIGGSKSARLGNTISGNTGADETGGGISLGTFSENPTGETYPQGNKIQGNSIGGSSPNSPSPLPVPNRTGILVFNALNNLIGGTDRVFGNFIVANSETGIKILLPATTGNIVQNNFIGVLANGINYGNGEHGILIVEAPHNQILANTIGGSGGDGINVSNVTSADPNNPSVTIAGNEIGVVTDPDGQTVAAANQNGIRITDSAYARVAEAALAPRPNVIAKNRENGIIMERIRAMDFSSNRVGVDRNGDRFGNGADGVNVKDSTQIMFEDNTVSGNTGNGFSVDNSNLSPEMQAEIQWLRNKIGIMERNEQYLKQENEQIGIWLRNNFDAIIGNAQKPNMIGGNGREGVKLENAVNTQLKRNYIGTSPARNNLGNGSHGIRLDQNSRLNVIGGPEEDSGNYIEHNNGAGVYLDDTAGHGNLIDPNVISNNAGLGIDLGALGKTNNDPGDGDDGPNALQNYPEIVSKQIVNDELVVGFKVDSAPGNSNYGTNGLYIEFFKSDASGEGEQFLGFAFYTAADYNPLAPGVKTVNLGNINDLGISPNDLLTATATDADNNTSEFFPPFAPTAATVMISGRVRNANGHGIMRANVTLTGADGTFTRTVKTNNFGNYRFAGVPAGQIYLVTVAHGRYFFPTDSRILNLTDDVSDVDFEAQ